MEDYAARQGLDFFPTIFEVVEADELNESPPTAGFPTRYPHWRFGMEYEQLSKGYHYGLQKIYELVINNNPVLRLLDEVQFADRPEAGDGPRLRPLRLLQEQLLVQPDQPQDDGRDGQPRQPHPPAHGSVQGVEEVENFIDACLSIEDLIDIHSPFIKRHDARDKYELRPRRRRRSAAEPPAASTPRLHGQRSSIRREVLAAEANAPAAGARRSRRSDFRAEPVRDVMLFILENAPLKPWQARRAVDHPRRSLLLRPARPNQDHERRLGQLLALDDHDPAGTRRRTT